MWRKRFNGMNSSGIGTKLGFEEGFDMFHMAEFVAKPEMGHKPFCDWDNTKRTRVYRRLASIINCRVRKGFAIARVGPVEDGGCPILCGPQLRAQFLDSKGRKGWDSHFTK